MRLSKYYDTVTVAIPKTAVGLMETRPNRLTVCLMGLIFLWLPLGILLPESWGWENCFLENIQLSLITLGACVSWKIAQHYPKKTKMKGFWLWSIAVWGLCLCRELSWGRSLFPKTPPGVEPDFYSFFELPFGHLVHPAIAIVAVIVLVGLLMNIDLEELFRSIRIPVWEMGILLFATVMATLCEKGVFPVDPGRAMVLEEFGETILWAALVGVVLYQLFMREEKEIARS